MGDMPFALYGPDMYQVWLHSMSAMGAFQLVCLDMQYVRYWGANSSFVSRQDVVCVAVSHRVHATLLNTLESSIYSCGMTCWAMIGCGFTSGATLAEHF